MSSRVYVTIAIEPAMRNHTIVAPIAMPQIISIASRTNFKKPGFISEYYRKDLKSQASPIFQSEAMKIDV